MHPRNIGRALGIGVRVAGRMAGQRIASYPQSASAAPHVPPGPAAAPVSRYAKGQAAAITAKQVATRARVASRGVGGLLSPFRRVGGIIWHEVTGALFLLFALLFTLRLWKNWSGYGQVSRAFAIAATAVFLYLGVSSFWRARRR
ncbi:MAG: hypothetical protein ABSF23_16950 [Terracidiphilus sp.]|jgi:hypothetical protein